MADEYLSSKLTASIDELSLSDRTSSILKQNGVRTVVDLLSLQRNDLLGIPGFDHNAMAEVRAAAQAYFLQLTQHYLPAEISRAIQETKRAKSAITQSPTPSPNVSQIEMLSEQSTHPAKQIANAETLPHPPTIWPSMRAAYKRLSSSSSETPKVEAQSPTATYSQQKPKVDNTTQTTQKEQLVWEIINQPKFDQNLIEADLEGANLSGAYLYRADLSRANLNKANLQGAKLAEAKLIEANLQEANLKDVKLRGAIMVNANLSGANLSELNLFKVDLTQANLSGANLDGTRLAGAKLLGANLSRVKLCKAHLNWANLSGVNLSETDLTGTDLNGVNLRGAYLAGADLRGADLRQAKIDETTQSGYGQIKVVIDNTTQIADKWRLAWSLIEPPESEVLSLENVNIQPIELHTQQPQKTPLSKPSKREHLLVVTII